MKIDFPNDVFKHIMSYFPKKKRFKFHPTTYNTDLHYIVHRIGMHQTPLSYKPNNRLIDEYIQNYCLTDNNYLQNIHGDTPLHIAAKYNILFQIYNKIKAHAPQMANVKNNQLKIPCEIIPYKIRDWTYRC
jgi:ankyrin repeat protein